MRTRGRRSRASPRRTKIICTIGPATNSQAAIRSLALAGMDVARLNFSYGSHAAHAETIRMLRSVADELGEPIGVLQDLSGPKLRVGELPGGGVELEAGREVVFSTARVVLPPKLPLPVPELAQAVKAGQRLMLADGQIEVTVLEAKKGEIRCRVRVGGRLESHQGVNAPEAALPVQTVTVKDLADLRFGLEHRVDWVAMSFVRTAEDLIPLRRAMSGAQAPPGLIAKIEKHEAVKRLSEIIAAADGVMVARGDLGIELPLAEVPMLQKEIIRLCNRAGKPAITATQMLESMITNSRPTRAEVSDVANAVLDGTDAVMLSGETAVGEHAEAAVAVMAEVVTKAEAGIDFEGRLEESRSWPCDGISDGISEAACGLARDVKARAIITATGSGYTAIMVSRHRPEMPLVAVTPDVATMRRLALVWGVHPVLAPRCRNTDELIVNAIGRARAAGWVSPGDRVVVTAGVPLGRGYTNLIKVEVVGRHHRLG